MKGGVSNGTVKRDYKKYDRSVRDYKVRNSENKNTTHA
jgi:hypothetical protein